MKSLFVSKRVENFIVSLDRSGKGGRNVAAKARAVISDLSLGISGHCPETVGALTKYGEKRIRNCRKYDLGSGFRLIVLQRADTVFACFLGTHDNCQRWLDRNSRLGDFVAGAGRVIPVSRKVVEAVNAEAAETAGAEDDGHELSEHYTEKELRAVFSGLVQGLK
jgi:hypothetical protein